MKCWICNRNEKEIWKISGASGDEWHDIELKDLPIICLEKDKLSKTIYTCPICESIRFIRTNEILQDTTFNVKADE